MRIELWIASPPTCSVRSPRASLTAIGGVPLAIERNHARGGGEREERARGDRRLIRAERVVRGAREPGADERAEAGAGIEAADDAGHRARAVEIHDDRRQERHARAVADA